MEGDETARMAIAVIAILPDPMHEEGTRKDASFPVSVVMRHSQSWLEFSVSLGIVL